MRIFATSMLALAALCGLVGCSESDGPGYPPPPSPEKIKGALVVNQGSMYSGISGTLDALDLDSGKYHSDVFAAVNGQSLGDSPQNGVAYGSKIYVSVFGSDLVWVLNRSTLAIMGSVTTTAPQYVCAAGGRVFISNNDGYVTCIDTTSYAVTAHVAVGPNPQHMVASDDTVYVSISDGYNYVNGYVDGFRVAKLAVDAPENPVYSRVGMNPGPLALDAGGNLFVVCRGDYATVPQQVYKVTPAGAVSVFCPATAIAARGYELYAANVVTDYAQYPPVMEQSYKVYDTRTGAVTVESLIAPEHQPVAPINMDMHPQTGEIFIGSNNSASDYTSRGKLHHYTLKGEPVAVYETGVAPYSVIFR